MIKMNETNFLLKKEKILRELKMKKYSRTKLANKLGIDHIDMTYLIYS